MKIFLTGAAGFIGSALATRLAGEGHEVTGLARSPETSSPSPGLRLVAGDLAVEDGLARAREALSEARAVVHLAAIRKDWGLSAQALRRVNVDSGPALLALASNAGRFLFVSSVAVYGPSRDGAPTREGAAFRPTKRYGASKVEAESALREASAARGVPLTIARPGITYGPGDTYGMVANLARLIAKRRFLMVGKGGARVNLLYVDDLARALSLALVAPAAAGEDVILAGGEPVEVGRLASVVAAEVGRRIPPVRVPAWSARLAARGLEALHGAFRPGEEPFLTRSKVELFTCDDLYDTAKAQAMLGFEPRVSLEEGVRAAIAWLRRTGRLT